MPLYELIVTTRCSNPLASANMLKVISKAILEQGGNVRSVQILGDRILTKKLMGKDRARHIIGRFVSILYDGNPEMYLKLQKQAFQSYETLRVQNFGVKDFIAEAVKFKKPLEEEAPFIKNNNLEKKNYGQAIKILKEQQNRL